MKSIQLLAAILAAAPAINAAELQLAVDTTQSRVEVVVKATVDSFVANLDAYEATIVIDPEHGQITHARFAFHFSDVKTGKADRDAEMHEWQGTSKHPDGVFVLSSITRGTDGTQIAAGVLTFHDQAKNLSFPVSVTREGTHYAIDGEAMFDTREFSLPIIRKFMVLKVDPEVLVRFHLQGAATAEKK